MYYTPETLLNHVFEDLQKPKAPNTKLPITIHNHAENIWLDTFFRTFGRGRPPTQVFGLDILLEAKENIRLVRENLMTAQYRQRSYADTRRRELSFEVGDYVYLKVSPIRGIKRFRVKGELAPRYIGPYQIQARRGEVAYQLSLPESLSAVHDMFHVSQLKKCLRVPEE
jgi:hypothetical protein